MREVSKLLLALVLVALLASALAACGGDGSDDSTAGSAATATAETPGSTLPGSGGSSGEASTAFRTPGGDNSIQNFGDEADATEVEEATAALAGYMQARAEGDWAGSCDYLAEVAVKPLEQLTEQSPQLKGKDCGAILAALSAGTPASARANTMSDGIASLRVEGERGFALYHGTEGVDYFVPMVKEDGEWKVSTLAPTEFP